jgi:hypothetical protein
MSHCVHVPAARRQTTPTGIDLVLVKLIGSAMNREWSPRTAATDVIADVDGNSRMLQQLRMRLLT